MDEKAYTNLTVEDLRLHPVWEMILDSDDEGDLLVRPIDELPVTDLGNRLVGVDFLLADGTKRFGILDNVCLRDPVANSHFASGSFITRSGWFHLARYFDLTYDRYGPQQLAKVFEKPLAHVFPISYDIADVAVGNSTVLRGVLKAVPDERLTEDEIMRLAVSTTRRG